MLIQKWLNCNSALPLLALPGLLLRAMEDLRGCHQVLYVLAQDLEDGGSTRTDKAPSPISTWFSDLSLRFSSFTLSTLQLRSERVFCSSSTWVMSLAFSSCSCCSLSDWSMLSVVVVLVREVAMVRVRCSAAGKYWVCHCCLPVYKCTCVHHGAPV